MEKPLHAVAVRSVSFDYLAGNDGGAITVLRDITFSVASQEFVCILGPSGCGKTTLLQIIAGLMDPRSGEVVLPPSSGRRPCTMMFQDLHLFYWQTALRNVQVVLECRGLNRAKAADHAQEYLAQVGLAGFGNHYPHELSGGMRQRLAIARVLATDAPTFLLDEPFNNLDMVSERNLETDFLRIWTERQLSALMVTHDVRKALRMADRIIVLSTRPGTILEEHHIALPRPRHGEVEFSPEFLLLEKQLCEAMTTSAAGLVTSTAQPLLQA